MKIDGYSLDEWFREEEHFRKKGHVFYIHTKYMLIDALSDSPQIFTGSANFSDSSVTGNDENMMLLHGPSFRAVADVYINEFMRLFNHLYFRTVAVRLAKEKAGGRAQGRDFGTDGPMGGQAFQTGRLSRPHAYSVSVDLFSSFLTARPIFSMVYGFLM